MASTDRLTPVVVQALHGSGFVLEGISLTPAGRRTVVRVTVDRDLVDRDVVDTPSEPMSLDDVAEATRTISTILDESDVMGELPYTLEVNSRGVDRPLELERHWRRNADRLVKVTLAGGDTFTGRIEKSDDTGATCDVEGTRRTVSYDEIAKALVQIEFNRKSEDDH